MQEKILEAIKKARDSKKRNFKQSFDISITLKNTDMKKQENKIKTEVSLPFPSGGNKKIGMFADNLIPQVRNLEGIVMIRRDEIENYGKDKKKSKKLANGCYSFISEAPLMPLVGKNLGQILAVRNKMPKPIPPTVSDLKPIIEREKNIIKIVLNNSPVFQCLVGKEDNSDEDILKNIETVLKALTDALPKGKDQMKNLFVKLTMGKPVKVELK